MNPEVPYMVSSGGKLNSTQIARFISDIPTVNIAAQSSPALERWQGRGLMPAVRNGLLLWRCSAAMGAAANAAPDPSREQDCREVYIGLYGGRMRLGQPFQSVGSMACAGPIGAATLGPRFKTAAGEPIPPAGMRLLALVCSDVRESGHRGAFYIHKGVPIAAYRYSSESYVNIDYNRAYSNAEIEMTQVARAPSYLAIDPLALIDA